MSCIATRSGVPLRIKLRGRAPAVVQPFAWQSCELACCRPCFSPIDHLLVFSMETAGDGRNRVNDGATVAPV